MRGAVIDSSAAIDIARGWAVIDLPGLKIYAPELIDLEFGNVLRKLLVRRELSEELADGYLAQWTTNRVTRCPHTPLLPRVWELRDNFTAYDASYVALAEYLGIPLLTTDRRLAHAAAQHSHIEILGD